MGCNHQHLLETVITVNWDTQVKGILVLCFSLHGDPLWDGMRCERRCCDKSPPWFSVTLPVLTSDNIEVRICDYDDGEDTPINLLEMYLQ